MSYMKKVVFLLVSLLVVSTMVFGQGKQPLPNFVGNPETTLTNIYGKGWPLGNFKGGVQGVRSAMMGGPHDFTPDSGRFYFYDTDSMGTRIDSFLHTTGPAYVANSVTSGSRRLCSYCHAMHIPKDGIANPLWSRKSVAGQTFGKYDNPSSMDATVYDPGTTDPVFKDNYSSMCLSCHDGSTGIFSSSKYESGGFPGNTAKVNDEFSFLGTGNLRMDHTHPVNFNYNAVQAVVPEELYPAVDPVSAVWKGSTGKNGTVVGNLTTVRLFNGTMQCSSCHNPHMNNGIGTVLTSDYARRCVACHKK
jgi:predicted CXXCH cytochrome family protein